MDPLHYRQLIRQSGLASVLDSIGHAVSVTNSSDEFVFVNPAFTRRYGWSEEELIGLRPSLLLPRSFPNSDLSLLRRKIAEPGSMWVGKVLNRCKLGVVCEVELAAFKIGLIEGQTPNLHLGLSTDSGRIAEQVASSLKVRVAAGQVAKAGTYGLPVKVNIRLECAELSVPDVRVSRENVVLASGAVFPAAPGAAVVEVDGLASGAAPGAIKMRPGFRRVRISRPGFETWERTVNAADGLSLVVPLKITADELERWRQMTLFLTRLQAGAKLTDAQIKVLEGEAARLAASGYRIDVKVDTKENFKFLVPGSQYVSP